MWYGKHIDGSPYNVSNIIRAPSTAQLSGRPISGRLGALGQYHKSTHQADSPSPLLISRLNYTKITVEGDGPVPTVDELVQKVKVSGKGLVNAKSQEYNEILIDCRRVYLKDHKLRCSVRSPARSSAMVKLQDNFDGTYSMFYKPTFTGPHLINIRVDDIHVLGSPFTVHVRN